MMPAPTALSFRSVTDGAVEDEPVSPPREIRATDLSKTSVPLPFMLTIIGLVVAIAAGVWRIDSRVSVINARLDAQDKYNADIKDLNKAYLDQLSKTLEQQIVNAGLRSTAMALTQELDNARIQNRGQRP